MTKRLTLALLAVGVVIAVPHTTAYSQVLEQKTFHDWILFDWCGNPDCTLPGPDTCCFTEPD